MTHFHSLSVQEFIVGSPTGPHTKITGDSWQLWAGGAPRDTRVYLHLENGFPELNFFDGNGTERLTIRIVPDGTPVIALYDGNGERRLALGVLEDGLSHLTFNHGDGDTPMQLEVQADGTPAFTLHAHKKED